MSPPPAPPDVGLRGAMAALSNTTAFFKEATANCCKEVKMTVMAAIVVLIVILLILIGLFIAWKRCRHAVRQS
jgi:uncharacterized membrane protein YdbT with pleckstrin-like domain